LSEGPTIQSWYSESGWKALRAYLDDPGRRFGCSLIDARDWSDEEEFSDSQHLRACGARRFSDRLGREALLPLLGRCAAPAGP
jgi:hypothetical protein